MGQVALRCVGRIPALALSDWAVRASLCPSRQQLAEFGIGSRRRDPARPWLPRPCIVAIDVVRGIALFGVMAINVTTEFRVSIFEQFLRDYVDGGWLDRALHLFLMIGIDLKAFA